MYTLIENFCLGLRRLELFGRPYSLRNGWATAGDFELTSELAQDTGTRGWDFEVWNSELTRDGMGRALVPMSQGRCHPLGHRAYPLMHRFSEIEILRPKSPNRSGHAHSLSNASTGSFGTPAGHVLPNRPSAGRPSGGGLGGGVGLGIVNRPPSQSVAPMNPPLGMPMGMAMMGTPQPMMMQPHMQQNFGAPMQAPPMGMPGMMGMPMMGMPMQFQQPMGMPMGMGLPMNGGYGEMMYPMGGMQGMPDPNGMGMMYNTPQNMMAGMGSMNMNMMGAGPGMNMNMMNNPNQGNGGGRNPNQNWNGMQ